MPLVQRRAAIEERLERVAERGDVITLGVRDTWAKALTAPLDTAPVWLHADLHAKNVLTLEGRIGAVVGDDGQ